MTSTLTSTASITYPVAYVQTLDVIDITITEDTTWSPRIQGNLTVPYSDALAALDPRKNDIGIKVKLQQEFGRSNYFTDLVTPWAGKTFADFATPWAGKTFADLRAQWWTAYQTPESPVVTRTFQLMLRAIEVDYLNGEIKLNVASEDALLHDSAWMYAAYSPSGISTITPAGGSIVPIVQEVLGWIGRTLNVWNSAYYDTTRTVDQRKIIPGKTYWDYLADLLGTLRVYADSNGSWWLADPSFTPSNVTGIAPPDIYLNKDTNLIKAEQKIDRDSSDYYTAAIITWRDQTQNPAVETLDTYMSTYTPIKVYSETINQPYPGYSVARRKYEAALQRSQNVAVTAVADLTAVPNGRALITTPQATLDTQITAVTFRLPADEMDITAQIGMS